MVGMRRSHDISAGVAATGWYTADGRGSLTDVTDAAGSLVQSRHEG